MKFDKDLEQYVVEYEGLTFAYDEEPGEGYMEQVKGLAESYHSRLGSIIRFMKPDIREAFGDFTDREIEEKLGAPIISPDRGQIDYLEQSFDDIHIFTIEFMSDDFSNLQYFSIDG